MGWRPCILAGPVVKREKGRNNFCHAITKVMGGNKKLGGSLHRNGQSWRKPLNKQKTYTMMKQQSAFCPVF